MSVYLQGPLGLTLVLYVRGCLERGKCCRYQRSRYQPFLLITQLARSFLLQVGADSISPFVRLGQSLSRLWELPSPLLQPFLPAEWASGLNPLRKWNSSVFPAASPFSTARSGAFWGRSEACHHKRPLPTVHHNLCGCLRE